MKTKKKKKKIVNLQRKTFSIIIFWPKPTVVHQVGGRRGAKLREKVTLKFISITLPIVPTVVTIKLIKLGSCNFT